MADVKADCFYRCKSETLGAVSTKEEQWREKMIPRETTNNNNEKQQQTDRYHKGRENSVCCSHLFSSLSLS